MSKQRSNGRSVPAIGMQEALELLASAINYCQQAGLLVQAGNIDGKLALTVEGAHVDRSGPVVRFVAGISAGNVPAIQESIAGIPENLSQQSQTG